MYTGNWDCCHHSAQPSGFYYVAMPACWNALPITCEIDADTTTPSEDGLVGGTSQTVSLSLEYLVDTGAASPSVTLTTTSNGASSTWSDNTPPVGYTVHQGVLSVKPGTKVTLAVNNATARLRWCETVCC